MDTQREISAPLELAKSNWKVSSCKIVKYSRFRVFFWLVDLGLTLAMFYQVISLNETSHFLPERANIFGLHMKIRIRFANDLEDHGQGQIQGHSQWKIKQLVGSTWGQKGRSSSNICLDLLVKNKYQLESSFKRVFLEYDWPKRFLK